MLKLKSIKKILALALIGALGLFLSTNLQAQDRPGGLFGRGVWFESEGLFRDGNPDNNSYNITNEDFGEEAPISSGLTILLGGSLVYVVLKRKEGKQ